MEKFRSLIYPLLEYLWDYTLATDVIEPTKQQEFVDLLTLAIECFNVRKFLTQKQVIRVRLDRRTLLNASLFLKRVFKGLEDGKAEQESPEKRACLEGLDDMTLGMLAVILKPDDIYKRSTNGIKVLSEGARRMTTWPCWRDQPELVKVVREQRPLTAATQSAQSSPQPFRDDPKSTLPPSIAGWPIASKDATSTAGQSRSAGIAASETDQPADDAGALQQNQLGLVHLPKDQPYSGKLQESDAEITQGPKAQSYSSKPQGSDAERMEDPEGQSNEGKPQDSDIKTTEDIALRRRYSASSTTEEPQPKRLNAGAYEQREDVHQDSGSSTPRSQKRPNFWQIAMN